MSAVGLVVPKSLVPVSVKDISMAIRIGKIGEFASSEDERVPSVRSA